MITFQQYVDFQQNVEFEQSKSTLENNIKGFKGESEKTPHVIARSNECCDVAIRRSGDVACALIPTVALLPQDDGKM